MINPFIEIVQKAGELNWCTEPYCTTCGSHEYRNELKNFSGDLGGGLSNALSDLEPNEITKMNNWRGSLVIAFIDLPFSLQAEGILESWLTKISENIEFTDFVLFKIVKYLNPDNDIRKKWISECIKMALDNKIFSLVESLILIIGKDISNYPELLKLGKEFAMTSNQMRRVLLNACNLKIKAA